MRFPTSGWLTVVFLLALVAPAHAQITPGGGVQLQNAGSPIGHTNTINCATGCTFSLVGGIGNLIVSGGSSGTVTQVNTSSPITGGPITTTGTIGCPSCVTSAASLTSTALMTGAGLQASQTPSATTTLDASGNLALAGGLTVTTRTGTPATMAVFTSGGVLAETTLPAAGVTSVTGTANQITSSPTTGAVILSLPSAVTLPGSLTVTTRTGTPATMAVFTSGGVLAETTLPVSGVTSATGTANQIAVSASTGAVTWSLPSAVTMPGSLTVTTRTGTPATMAVFTSGGVLAETTLPTSGTVTSIATTSPITGGTITTTGTIACATCVTAASALTSGHLVAGAGGQATAITDLTGDTTTSGGVATTTGKVNGVTYPASPSTNTVPVVTGTNTITYEAVPNAALANSSVTVNGTTCTLGSSCSPSAAATTVISWSNAPIPADWGAQLLTMSSTLTVRYAQYVQIPYAITVNQITVAFGPVTTPGTFKECVYSADGSSKLIDITVTPVAASLVSGAVSAVTIGPGSFWFVIGGATTNSGVQIRAATTEAGVSSFGTAARPSGKTVWHGTVSHTSGTCNTTLGTVTASGDVIPNFFFDN